MVARFGGRISGDENPVGTAVSGDHIPGESTRALPRILLPDGKSLAERLRQEAIPEMDQWIEGDGPDPLPRALLRLLTALVDRGESLADQSEIVAYWLPGRPPAAVYDGPATLAQIIEKRIRLYFSDPETEAQMVIDFEP